MRRTTASTGLARDTEALTCPVCGDVNIHPVSVVCNSPGRAEGRVTIDEHGLAVDPRTPPVGRGVRIELAFSCESQHAFSQIFHFTKGATTLEVAIAERPDPRTTIWRS